jgi:predicted GIY-YIG superfamily endonuclease
MNFLYWLRFPNGKLYFGLSNNVARRWQEHQKLAVAGSMFPVHRAISKFGADQVAVRNLAAGSRHYIKTLEITAIAAFKTRSRRFGYNLTKGGDISPSQSPEVAAKMAATKRGRELSEATRQGWLAWIAAIRDTHCQRRQRTPQGEMVGNVRREPGCRQKIGCAGRPSVRRYKSHRPIALMNIRAAAAEARSNWLVNITAANQRAEFTPARAAQLAAARQNVDHAARTAKSPRETDLRLIPQNEKCGWRD